MSSAEDGIWPEDQGFVAVTRRRAGSAAHVSPGEIDHVFAVLPDEFQVLIKA